MRVFCAVALLATGCAADGTSEEPPSIYLEVGSNATLTGTYDAEVISASGNITTFTPPDISLFAMR